MKKLLQIMLCTLFIAKSGTSLQAAHEAESRSTQERPANMTDSQITQAQNKALSWAKENAKLPGGKPATTENLQAQHDNLASKETLNNTDKITLHATKIALTNQGIDFSSTPKNETDQTSQSGTFDLNEASPKSPTSITEVDNLAPEPAPNDINTTENNEAMPTPQPGKLNFTPEQMDAFNKSVEIIDPKQLAQQLASEANAFAENPNDPDVQKDLTNKIRTSFYQGRIDVETAQQLDKIIGDALEKARDENLIKTNSKSWFSRTLQSIKDQLTRFTHFHHYVAKGANMTLGTNFSHNIGDDGQYYENKPVAPKQANTVTPEQQTAQQKQLTQNLMKNPQFNKQASLNNEDAQSAQASTSSTANAPVKSSNSTYNWLKSWGKPKPATDDEDAYNKRVQNKAIQNTLNMYGAPQS